MGQCGCGFTQSGGASCCVDAMLTTLALAAREVVDTTWAAGILAGAVECNVAGWDEAMGRRIVSEQQQ